MKIIRNKYIPFKRFDAMNLFGMLFCHPDTRLTPQLVNHERIHTYQMLEMLVIGFYLWYVIEWFIRLFKRGNAYFNISFEREAYRHMHDLEYLKKRKHFAWWKYLKKTASGGLPRLFPEANSCAMALRHACCMSSR